MAREACDKKKDGSGEDWRRPSRRRFVRDGATLLSAALFLGPAALRAAGRKTSAGPVVIACTGDVTLGYHFDEYAAELEKKKGWTREEVYNYPFAKVKKIFERADIVLANCESQFTTSADRIEKNFTFKASPHLVGCLKAGGIDVVTLANNHAMDYGAPGLAETLETLDKAGIARFGAGKNLAEARRPAFLERKGLVIAFLGYMWLPENSVEPQIICARPDRPGVAGVIGDPGKLLAWLKEDLRAVRKKNPAARVVVSFHWGLEGYHRAGPEQRLLAGAAVEAGVDFVVGHHPHVLQNVETHRGAPIFYSLGNFVFGGNWSPRVKDSALALVTLGEKGVTGYELVPVKIDEMPERPFLPHPLEGEERERVLGLIESYSLPEGEEGRGK